jgi:hypothetical protein
VSCTANRVGQVSPSAPHERRDRSDQDDGGDEDREPDHLRAEISGSMAMT